MAHVQTTHNLPCPTTYPLGCFSSCVRLATCKATEQQATPGAEAGARPRSRSACGGGCAERLAGRDCAHSKRLRPLFLSPTLAKASRQEFLARAEIRFDVRMNYSLKHGNVCTGPTSHNGTCMSRARDQTLLAHKVLGLPVAMLNYMRCLSK